MYRVKNFYPFFFFFSFHTSNLVKFSLEDTSSTASSSFFASWATLDRPPAKFQETLEIVNVSLPLRVGCVLMFQCSLEFEILGYPSFLRSKNYSSFLRVFNGSPVSPQSEAYFQEFPVASLSSVIRKVRIHECCSTGKPLEIYRFYKNS